MELKSLTIRNFKALQNIHLAEIPNFVVLVGANGSRAPFKHGLKYKHLGWQNVCGGAALRIVPHRVFQRLA